MYTHQQLHVNDLFKNNLNITVYYGIISQKNIKIHFALFIQTAKVSIHNPHTVGLIVCLFLFNLALRHNRT